MKSTGTDLELSSEDEIHGIGLPNGLPLALTRSRVQAGELFDLDIDNSAHGTRQLIQASRSRRPWQCAGPDYPITHSCEHARLLDLGSDIKSLNEARQRASDRRFDLMEGQGCAVFAQAFPEHAGFDIAFGGNIWVCQNQCDLSQGQNKLEGADLYIFSLLRRHEDPSKPEWAFPKLIPIHNDFSKFLWAAVPF